MKNILLTLFYHFTSMCELSFKPICLGFLGDELARERTSDKKLEEGV